MEVVAVVVLLVLLAVVLIRPIDELSAYRRTLARRRVIVNLKSGEAIEGVVVARHGPWLVIADPVLHDGPGDPVRPDGTVLVERRDVAFVQVRPEVGV